MQGTHGVLESKAYQQQAGNPVLVSTDLTTIAEFEVAAMERLGLALAVLEEALTEFEVQARFVEGGTYFTIASATADFTTGKEVIVWATGDLTVAVAGAHACLVNVLGIRDVRIQAKSAGGTATLAIQGGAN